MGAGPAGQLFTSLRASQEIRGRESMAHLTPPSSLRRHALHRRRDRRWARTCGRRDPASAGAATRSWTPPTSRPCLTPTALRAWLGLTGRPSRVAMLSRLRIMHGSGSLVTSTHGRPSESSQDLLPAGPWFGVRSESQSAIASIRGRHRSDGNGVVLMRA